MINKKKEGNTRYKQVHEFQEQRSEKESRNIITLENLQFTSSDVKFIKTIKIYGNFLINILKCLRENKNNQLLKRCFLALKCYY